MSESYGNDFDESASQYNTAKDQRILALEHALKEAVAAFDDIADLHEKGLAAIENRVGFLGWTCCQQKEALARKARAAVERALGQ